MSAFGPKRTSLVAPHMSAFVGKADMTFCGAHVCFRPKADIVARITGRNFVLQSDESAGRAKAAANPLVSQSRRDKMATRESRLAQFSQGVPKENRPLQILCEDQSGTYVIPYPCEWSEGVWRKVGSSKHIEATVIGWRVVRFR